MRRFTPFLILLLPLLAQATLEIKFATLAPRNSTWMNIMEELDAELRAATQDEVGFKFYPGQVQGDEPDVIRKIRLGQLHGGGFTGVGMGIIQPAVRVLDLPMLFNSPEEVDAVDEGLFTEFSALFDEKGFVLLGWAEVGPVHIFSAETVQSVAELQQQKLWLWEGDPVAGRFFEELGLRPISLSLTDVFTGFQTGMINAAYASPYAASAMQWQSHVACITATPITVSHGAVLVSKRIVSKLDDEQRQHLMSISRRHLRRLTEASRAENATTLEVFQQAGIHLQPWPDAEVLRLREAGVAVREGLSAELYPPEVLASVLARLNEFRNAAKDVAP